MNARLTTAVAALALAAGSANAAIIDRSVHRALASSVTVDLLVRVKPSVPATELVREATSLDRGEHITALKASLVQTHADALDPLSALFAKESRSSSVQVQTYWIAPIATVKGATLDDVNRIAALPNVLEVREVQTHQQPTLAAVEADATANKGAAAFPSTFEWGVGKIEAPKLWKAGNTGQGVRIGTIDSGVRVTHEALHKNFGGAYSWFDPRNHTALPHDEFGHGTHTMGTIAGTNGIGVAPGVTWMTCRACNNGCKDDDIFACAQFMMCPTDTNGANPDCSKAPRLVSNSWVTVPGDDFYVDLIANWVKAGIIPVFAVGNSGPECGTASSPGDYPNVIGVGSTSKDDALSDFSAKGPGMNSTVKPDLTAPGESIRSAGIASDTAYKVASGSSMAAPHVAGAIALLLESEPHLTANDVKARLLATTVQTGLKNSNFTCGETTDAMWPNNQFGHGRLDIYNAVKKVTHK